MVDTIVGNNCETLTVNTQQEFKTKFLQIVFELVDTAHGANKVVKNQMESYLRSVLGDFNADMHMEEWEEVRIELHEFISAVWDSLTLDK